MQQEDDHGQRDPLCASDYLSGKDDDDDDDNDGGADDDVVVIVVGRLLQRRLGKAHLLQLVPLDCLPAQQITLPLLQDVTLHRSSRHLRVSGRRRHELSRNAMYGRV